MGGSRTRTSCDGLGMEVAASAARFDDGIHSAGNSSGPLRCSTSFGRRLYEVWSSRTLVEGHTSGVNSSEDVVAAVRRLRCVLGCLAAGQGPWAVSLSASVDPSPAFSGSVAAPGDSTLSSAYRKCTWIGHRESGT